ncbi:MAG: O-acetyl-ADP-ribose deacetylase [Actinomycetia bacterium]|nr:O-acetyl-ADP-ribose deacetylase [Actinomycetes bacterium]
MGKIIHEIGKTRLELVQGDITRQDTEAIVNAANSRLSPGGGVSGAIHRAAGPQLWQECKTLGGCHTGEAKITRGYNLPAKYVIHTVGPVYSNSSSDPVNLGHCYRNSLAMASKKHIESISFPSISTGIFGYPVNQASAVALNTIIDYLTKNQNPKLVRLVLFSSTDFQSYRSSLNKITG